MTKSRQHHTVGDAIQLLLSVDIDYPSLSLSGCADVCPARKSAFTSEKIGLSKSSRQIHEVLAANVDLSPF